LSCDIAERLKLVTVISVITSKPSWRVSPPILQRHWKQGSPPQQDLRSLWLCREISRNSGYMSLLLVWSSPRHSPSRYLSQATGSRHDDKLYTNYIQLSQPRSPKKENHGKPHSLVGSCWGRFYHFHHHFHLVFWLLNEERRTYHRSLRHRRHLGGVCDPTRRLRVLPTCRHMSNQLVTSGDGPPIGSIWIHLSQFDEISQFISTSVCICTHLCWNWWTWSVSSCGQSWCHREL
jgi:hypothetical protein